jgi:hypothetical protein
MDIPVKKGWLATGDTYSYNCVGFTSGTSYTGAAWAPGTEVGLAGGSLVVNTSCGTSLPLLCCDAH